MEICPCANGFPYLAQGLHVVVLRSSGGTGNTYCQETTGGGGVV